MKKYTIFCEGDTFYSKNKFKSNDVFYTEYPDDEIIECEITRIFKNEVNNRKYFLIKTRPINIVSGNSLIFRISNYSFKSLYNKRILSLKEKIDLL